MNSPEDEISFGPYTLRAAGRMLLRENTPQDLGSRAFDILWMLASRPNEIISKREILEEVWPETRVDDGSLRFQIANLRRILGSRYISTVVGRGYSFVADPSTGSSQGSASTAASYAQRNLPGRTTHIVGRTEDCTAVASLLASARLVTIVGAGGVGKTTVAVSIAHDLFESFNGAIHFVDLGAINDPSVVASTVLSTLGVPVTTEDSISALIAYLGKTAEVMLLVDNCEHLIDEVARFVSRILAAAPSVRILATSREQLQIDGEHVYKLNPLAFAPDQALGLELVKSYPATQLFLQRVAASGVSLLLAENDANILSALCRRLDGLPLAIELAAARVGSYGLNTTADLLEKEMMLSWPGQRTAPIRQKSLQAALDWSYRLLSDLERRLLRQFAVFVGHFSIEAAVDVASPLAEREQLFGAIDSLVSKSMIIAWTAGPSRRYRLLDTTRVHALSLRTDDGEFNAMAMRHASHWQRWLRDNEALWKDRPSPIQRSLNMSTLANVRTALDWCFGHAGDARLGIGLVVAATPMFLTMSLLRECQRWVSLALELLGKATGSDMEEMHLQAALGVCLMFTRGESETARKALLSALAFAENSGDVDKQLAVLGPLHLFHLSTGEFNVSLQYAEQAVEIAREREPSALAHANLLIGVSLHLKGDLPRAERALLRAAEQNIRESLPKTYLGVEGSVTDIFLARTLWLVGKTNDAIAQAEKAVGSARRADHPLSLSIATMWATTVYLWHGDLVAAAKSTESLHECSEAYSLGAHRAVAQGFRGELAIKSGDLVRGIALLKHSLSELHQANYRLHTTPLTIALIDGLRRAAHFDEASGLLLDTQEMVRANGDTIYLPELLRLEACIRLSTTTDAISRTIDPLVKAVELSRLQGALGWRLRASLDLASVYTDQGLSHEATSLLQEVLDHFDSKSDSVDVRTARRFILNKATK